MKILDDVTIPETIKTTETLLGKYAEAMIVNSAEHSLIHVL